MVIRKATVKDSEALSQLLFIAMEDILYHFIGIKNDKEAKGFLKHFTQRKNNQYSFENCFVAENGVEIIGAINIYDGGKLKILRTPIEKYINTQFKSNYIPEAETQEGEWYIDSFAVSPDHRGKGVGTIMLEHAIDFYAFENSPPLGLLVDYENRDAKKMYLKMGFKYVNSKTLAGKLMEHLQLETGPQGLYK